MENEWLELAYINFDKVIMHGQVIKKEEHGTLYVPREVQIEQVLTQEQREQVYGLNEKHEREMRELLRSFVV